MTTPGYIPPGDSLDIRDVLRLVRRRAWILIACLILIPAAAYLITANRPKVFEASTILQVENSLDSTGLANPDFAAPASNLEAIAGFVGTTAVLEEAARELGVPPGSLAGAAHATADDETGFLRISATASTAQRATDIANAYASALNATREKRGVERIDEAIGTVRQNLRDTPKSETARRTQLATQLQQLQTLRQAQSQNVNVLQPATGARQIAPHPKRNATVAILLAAFVGLGLILLSERFDRKLRRPEDLERLTGLPFLATIPSDAFPGSEQNPEVPEAFQTLRNTLTYFNADGTVDSLLVTSGLKGEGKTTVAANLALAYAAFGKRVIAVDTDLRKPDLAARLGFSDSTGLTDVLAGTTSLDAALREVPPYGRGLQLLPAGPIPPNPSAMLGSLRMASLIDELVERADIVILDTTPLLMVSDAFPLLDKVSGILALARLDSSPREAIRRMAQIMTSAGGRVLGLVATDTKISRLTGYGYGYGYGYGAGYGAERRGSDPAHRSPEAQPGDPADLDGKSGPAFQRTQ